MNSVLAAVIPTLIVAVITWWFARVQRDRDALSAAQVARIYALEQHAGVCTEKFHELDVRQARSETEAEGLAGQMVSLRVYLDERFESLNTRIDDALRRSSTPHPTRRR